MIDFVYTKDRLPDKKSFCVIWEKDNKDGRLAINTWLAQYNYHDDGKWRFVPTEEEVQDEVVKYIEISAEDRAMMEED